MKLIKGFVTYKCKKCYNVMREEYNPKGKPKSCKVCNTQNWVKIIMNEVRK